MADPLPPFVDPVAALLPFTTWIEAPASGNWWDNTELPTGPSKIGGIDPFPGDLIKVFRRGVPEPIVLIVGANHDIGDFQGVNPSDIVAWGRVDWGQVSHLLANARTTRDFLGGDHV